MHDLPIESVQYYEADEGLPAYYGGFSPSGHSVGMGVEFIFPGGQALSLTWINPHDVDGVGYAGYLAVVELPMDCAMPQHEFGRYDVSDWPEWQPYLGHRITKLDYVWDTEASMRDAVQLHVADRLPVTVALGGTDSRGAVTYHLDNLVVFHDDGAARTYLDWLRKRELTVPAEVMLAARRSG